MHKVVKAVEILNDLLGMKSFFASWVSRLLKFYHKFNRLVTSKEYLLLLHNYPDEFFSQVAGQ